VSPSQNTTYTVTIINDSGCVFTQSVTVDVICGNIFVPNAFSPGNGNQNRVLYVRGPCIQTMYFIVFDRWGNKVFESENPDNGWDGTYKGFPMNVDTYLWYLKATLFDGTIIEKKGSVALVR
jgi:gliding motility-associated-like protein